LIMRLLSAVCRLVVGKLRAAALGGSCCDCSKVEAFFLFFFVRCWDRADHAQLVAAKLIKA